MSIGYVLFWGFITFVCYTMIFLGIFRNFVWTSNHTWLAFVLAGITSITAIILALLDLTTPLLYMVLVGMCALLLSVLVLWISGKLK